VEAAEVLVHYPSNLTDTQWTVLEPLLSEPQGAGRWPAIWRRRILNGLLYLDRTGRQWRANPREFGPWKPIRYCCDRWPEEGTLERIHTVLRDGPCASAWSPPDAQFQNRRSRHFRLAYSSVVVACRYASAGWQLTGGRWPW